MLRTFDIRVECSFSRLHVRLISAENCSIISVLLDAAWGISFHAPHQCTTENVHLQNKMCLFYLYSSSNWYPETSCEVVRARQDDHHWRQRTLDVDGAAVLLQRGGEHSDHCPRNFDSPSRLAPITYAKTQERIAEISEVKCLYVSEFVSYQ